MNQDKIGTITFSTLSALAIWKAEVLGQLSDGTWENTAPFDHWEFWHRLEAKVGDACKVEAVFIPWHQKCGYNIGGLVNRKWNDDGSPNRTGEVYILRDRMLAQGRLGRAIYIFDDWETFSQVQGVFDAAEELAELGTLEAYAARMAVGAKDERDAEYGAFSRLSRVNADVARVFYATRYELRDLRQDVKFIKEAMNSIKARAWG